MMNQGLLWLLWLGSATCLWSSQLHGADASSGEKHPNTTSSIPTVKTSQSEESSENSNYNNLDSTILDYLQQAARQSNGFQASPSRLVGDEADLRDWKRAHSFVHFGKRADEEQDEYDQDKRAGHSLMHFGKRDDESDENYLEEKRGGHSLMHFGKRGEDYQDDKRGSGHNLMHFGKRNEDFLGDKRAGHSLMHFGKRDEDFQGDKRAGHSLMHFGKRDEDFQGDKRAGHSLMHFGKRDNSYEFQDDKRGGHSLMHFGKRGTGHNLMHFGKRDDSETDYDKRGGHSLMHFGKRDNDVEDYVKRGGHSLMHFGKRDNDVDDYDKRGGHSLMHFGKRPSDLDSEEDLDPEEKRAGHSLMHFGKKSDVGVEEATEMGEDKRAGHSLMHFGKRNDYQDDKRGGHSLMHFGKRNVGEVASSAPAYDRFDLKRGHSLMHFGKRSVIEPQLFQVQKRGGNTHSLMHFGKRTNEESVGTTQDSTRNNLVTIEAQAESGTQAPTAISAATGKVRTSRSIHPFHLEYSQNPFFRAFIQELWREQIEDTKRAQNMAPRVSKSSSGHGFLHFGKRAGHSLMHFGKRAFDEPQSDENSYEDADNDFEDEEESEEDATQRDIFPSWAIEQDGSDTKRSPHSMIHFGKRGDNRDSHAMLHFGKRALPSWMSSSERDSDLKRAHAMIHFGKRNLGNNDFQLIETDEDNGYVSPYYRKRPSAGHRIMRFGKRSVPVNEEQKELDTIRESQEKNTVTRKRRYASLTDFFGGWPAADLNGRTISAHQFHLDPSTRASTFLLPHAISAADMSTIHMPMFMGHLNRIQRAAYPYYGLVNKKEHKNVFLHFGRR